MTSTAHVGVVFVERLTVVKDEAGIDSKLVQCLVSETQTGRNNLSLITELQSLQSNKPRHVFRNVIS